MSFNSKIFILPGLGNSGEQHWQSIWEKEYPELIRINQREWETPECSEWISEIDEKINKYSPNEVILVGHSLACCTIAFWSRKYNRKIKGALLVAPSDTEAPTYPKGTIGFTPVPLIRLPFKSIVVASGDDYYVTPERAMFFANAWGSEFINIANAGHINTASGYGEWKLGLELLTKLDTHQ